MTWRLTHIPGALRDAAASLRSRRDGVSAVEFALVAPIFLLIMAATIDLGGALFTKLRIDSAISAGANYALIAGQDVSDDSGDALETKIAGMVAGSFGANGSTITVGINGGSSVTIADGIAGAPDGSSRANRCYCPERVDRSITWGGSVTCSSACPGGGLAGKFVTITAYSAHEPLFPQLGMLREGMVAGRAVVQIQ